MPIVGRGDHTIGLPSQILYIILWPVLNPDATYVLKRVILCFDPEYTCGTDIVHIQPHHRGPAATLFS